MDRDKCWAVVNAVTNLKVLYTKYREFLDKLRNFHLLQKDPVPLISLQLPVIRQGSGGSKLVLTSIRIVVYSVASEGLILQNTVN
jgi:hypothetical protein